MVALSASASVFYLACGADPNATDGGNNTSKDGGTTKDGGTIDPLCTGVVCNPGFTCKNGVCEMDPPMSG